MNEGDYDTATSVIDFAKRLLAFQKKVTELEKEWDDLEDLRDKATPAVQEIVSKRFFGRRKRDFLTHLHATLNAPSHPVRNRLIRLIRRQPRPARHHQGGRARPVGASESPSTAMCV